MVITAPPSCAALKRAAKTTKAITNILLFQCTSCCMGRRWHALPFQWCQQHGTGTFRWWHDVCYWTAYLRRTIKISRTLTQPSVAGMFLCWIRVQSHRPPCRKETTARSSGFCSSKEKKVFLLMLSWRCPRSFCDSAACRLLLADWGTRIPGKSMVNKPLRALKDKIPVGFIKKAVLSHWEQYKFHPERQNNKWDIIENILNRCDTVATFLKRHRIFFMRLEAAELSYR